MQTNPIATTNPTGQAQQHAGLAGAAGKPGAGVGTIFAVLVQSLTGEAQAAAVPSTASGPRAVGAGGQAEPAEGDRETQPTEAGSEADMVAVAQLQGLEIPVSPLATQASAPAGGAAPASPGAAAPQGAAGLPQAASSPVAPSAAAADALSAGAESNVVAPPSAQAVELAKVVGAGTQVHVTRAAEGPAPSSPPVQGLATVAVAAALEETAVAAVAEPLVRTAPAGPKTAPSVTAAFSVPADGATTTASAGPNAVTPAKPATALHEKAGAAPGAAATGAADGAPATPATVSSAGSLAPDPSSQGVGEAAGEPVIAASSGRDGQAGANQAPAPAVATPAQQAAPMPERAAAPAFPAAPPAGQVSVHFAKAVRSGVDRIEIQLSPASLGRVEIRPDLSDQHQVRASISAETKEALDLLRADVRVLERALQDVGLKTDPGSLSFQLRDHGARAGHDGGSRQGYSAHPGHQPDTRDAAASRVAETPARPAAPSALLGSGRIDIHA